jgi:hypothetical protein
MSLAIDTRAREEPGLATWLGFLLMCLGMFMAILDIQVVATSLPAIQEALEISRGHRFSSASPPTPWSWCPGSVEPC